ncbi:MULTISPECIES: hypothetical protein [Kamptonema]|uniref:hypothetical protein n=1 Tax=Kamptonema TaxID=1501433 RepID=UPI0001DAC4C7|nr:MULTISPECIES: hypothetical protein [Kamptonema]CBN59063.1 conserved hypothetical protein [Kamptonema sp. PCC 6506]
MMSKNCRKAWHEFCKTISQIDEQDTALLIFQYLRTWYQENKMLLSPHLIDEYGLEELINIDPNSYPIERSECTPEIIKRFLDFAPSSEQSMVAILRDQLWEIVVLSVDVECQRCGKLELSALFDTEAQKVVLECTQCGLIYTIDGHRYQSIETVRLAQNDDLKNAGLL